MAQFWGYNATTASKQRRFSPGLWGDCPYSAIIDGLVDGVAYQDDFDGGGPIVSAGAQAAYGKYNGFASTGASTSDAGVQFGALTFTPAGSNTGVSTGLSIASLLITQAAGDLWFEAAFQTSTIADTQHDIFCGLLDARALTVAVPLTQGSPTKFAAACNAVGFLRDSAASNGAQMSTVYQAGGVSPVTVQASAVSLTAATAVRVGMRYNHEASTLYFYQNGVQLSGSKVVPNATATDFPAVAILRPVFAVLSETSSAGTSALDWWAFAQLGSP